jgi:hypothetical protein
VTGKPTGLRDTRSSPHRERIKGASGKYVFMQNNCKARSGELAYLRDLLTILGRLEHLVGK